MTDERQAYERTKRSCARGPGSTPAIRRREGPDRRGHHRAGARGQVWLRRLRCVRGPVRPGAIGRHGRWGRGAALAPGAQRTNGAGALCTCFATDGRGRPPFAPGATIVRARGVERRNPLRSLLPEARSRTQTVSMLLQTQEPGCGSRSRRPQATLLAPGATTLARFASGATKGAGECRGNAGGVPGAGGNTGVPGDPQRVPGLARLRLATLERMLRGARRARRSGSRSVDSEGTNGYRPRTHMNHYFTFDARHDRSRSLDRGHRSCRASEAEVGPLLFCLARTTTEETRARCSS